MLTTKALRIESPLQGLVGALARHSPEIWRHSRRTACYARQLGQVLGLSVTERSVIERGALLHDIGKLHIDAHILLKPGKLTLEEWQEMKRHPLLGYQLLRSWESQSDARQVVLQHHEHWNGAGYPMGLCGEEICLGARIVAIVDAYDAITSDRPYHRAQDYDAARQELLRCAGMQFDPHLVKAWCQVPLGRWQQIAAEC